MKDKKKVTNLLCQISDSLTAKDEHLQLLNLAVNFGLINGQMLQVNLRDFESLEFSGITFGEYGMGLIIKNSLKH